MQKYEEVEQMSDGCGGCRRQEEKKKTKKAGLVKGTNSAATMQSSNSVPAV